MNHFLQKIERLFIPIILKTDLKHQLFDNPNKPFELATRNPNLFLFPYLT